MSALSALTQQPLYRAFLSSSLYERVATSVPRPVVVALSRLKVRIRLARASRTARPLVRAMFGRDAAQKTLSSTGDVLVTRVEQPHDPTLILKVAQSEPAALQLQLEADALAELNQLAHEVIDDLPVAELIEFGGFGPASDTAWLTQSYLPGAATSELPLDNKEILSIAARTLVPFYESTQTQVICTPQIFHRLVGAPIETIVRWRPEWRDQLTDLQTKLAGSLSDHELSLSRIHGDLGPTNVLWNVDTQEISGIVDWTFATDKLPSEIDLVHLAISLLSSQRNAEYGDIVVQLCNDRDVDVTALETVESAVACAPNGLELALAAILSWLHHVSFGLERQEQLRNNPLWLHNNIDVVVSAVSSLQLSPLPVHEGAPI